MGRGSITLLVLDVLIREVGVAHFQQQLNGGGVEAGENGGSDAVENQAE